MFLALVEQIVDEKQEKRGAQWCPLPDALQ
jgi:hypothetical protein